LNFPENFVWAKKYKILNFRRIYRKNDYPSPDGSGIPRFFAWIKRTAGKSS